MFTLTNVILGVIALLVVTLVFKAFTGKSKPAEQRTSLEKIACSLLVIGRKNVDDAANSIRTAKVMKAEALQEINDALLNLKTNFKQSLVNLKVAHKTLTEKTLPNLKDQPGKLEAKAREAKKSYQASVEKGTPIEAYKNNAKNYLTMKAQALKNIEKATKMQERLEIAIETSKAEYEGRLISLEMIKTELESMIDIPRIELNESLERIKSLQSELNTRMDRDQIRSEVDNEVNNIQEQSYSADIDAEFDNL